MNDGLLPTGPPASAPRRSIASRADFRICVHAAIDEAAMVGCRELWLADAYFAQWPLGERSLVESLARWARPARRQLHLLATSFEAIGRSHPRWVDWRRQWAHRVDCRANTELEPGKMPTLLIAPGLFSLCLRDPTRCLGRWSHDTDDERLDRAKLDAALQQSQPAFPAFVTGL